MTTTTLPSGTGVVSTYSYDNANRLSSIVHDKGGTIASVSYTLDNVGTLSSPPKGCPGHHSRYVW